MCLAGRLPGGGLGDPELQQEPGTLGDRRRLGQRAAQQDRGGLGRATARRGARGVDEAVRDPWVAGGVGGEQVLGRVLLAARVTLQELGRTAVRERALGAGELLVDAGAHERMDEGQRALGLEDAGRHERVCGLGGLRGLELGQGGRARQVGVLEHGDGAGQPRRRRRQAARRSWIQRRAVRAPTASTCAAARASGVVPATLSASRSSRTRNGEPPVARWQAAVKAWSGAMASRVSTRRPTAATLSGSGWTTSAWGSAVSVASRCASSASASGRVATRSATFSSSRRGSRKARKRSEEASAQCASSTLSTTSWSAARFAHSQ